MASNLEVAVENDSTLRRAFVVLGMHRSGTSAMTRTLSLLGAGLPKGLMPAVENNNECGFWEAKSVADLNDEILEALDSGWDDVFSFRPREYLSNFDRFHLGRAVELLDAEFNGSEVIALKDPRISILTSFWERALRQAGYATHYIVMVRNPLEVAESLRARDEFPREKSLLLWSSYMIAADRDTREQNRIFVSYDQLMNDWRGVRRRIEENAGFPFPRDTSTAANEVDRFLSRRFRHFDTPDSDIFSRSDVPDEVKTLYRIFSGACEGAEIDRAELEAVERELAKMDLLVGPLLADLRGRVRSLAREVGTLNQAQADATERAEALQQELAAERSNREQEIAGERSIREQELAAERSIREQAIAAVEAARRQAAAAESERNRFSADLEVKEREAADLRRRLADAAGDLERERVAASDARSALARREAELMAELSKRGDEIAKLNRKLSESEDEIDSVRSTLSEREKTLGAAVDQARVEKEAVSARLDGRFREIATLTNLLAEQESRERQSRREADWLREAASVLLNDSKTRKGSLMRFMPTMFHVKRQRKQLQRKGIFDGDAYLAVNADVAADGADPLTHYLTHGISENRRRG